MRMQKRLGWAMYRIAVLTAGLVAGLVAGLDLGPGPALGFEL